MIQRGKGYRILVVAVMTLWLSSLQGVCAGTLMPWSEAREVVREAYRMHGEGKAYEDSVSLAQAYTELKKWKYLFPTDYVRACYYYGRWLREHEHPVLSMQVLLDATHVRTKDYIILGRVYSNIGTMCRMANCYDLAYEIFQRSNACFLQAGDSTLYYYGLNNMAYVKAVAQDKIGSDSIIAIIRSKCNNQAVLTKILETQASACLSTEQYDSVIYYTTKLFKRGYHDPTGYCYTSVAWYYLNIPDSALIYARQVIATTKIPSYLISAYYILSHNDSTLSADSILAITSMRADAQNEWGIHHGKLTQAVQLLEDDLSRKPDWRWLYAVIGTILILSIGICIYIVRRKRQNRLLIQKINSAREEGEQLVAQNEHLQQETERRRADMMAQIEEQCLMFQQTENFQEILHWNDFQQLCEVINQHFFFLADKLKRLNLLNEQESRLCFLVLIGQFSDKQMADILNYSSKSIRTIKRNTAIKINTTSKNLRTFLLEIVLK